MALILPSYPISLCTKQNAKPLAFELTFELLFEICNLSSFTYHDPDLGSWVLIAFLLMPIQLC